MWDFIVSMSDKICSFKKYIYWNSIIQLHFLDGFIACLSIMSTDSRLEILYLKINLIMKSNQSSYMLFIVLIFNRCSIYL